MKRIHAIYGAGGYGREVMPILRTRVDEQTTVMFVVDDVTASTTINGYSVISYTEFCQLEADEKYFTIAIADSAVRQRIYNRCLGDGLLPASVLADNVVMMDDVSIGTGAILSPFCCLTSNIRIGVCFHANIYSYIGHDCRIGDFVTLAPGVKCNGNVVIEDHVYIGAGAIIKPGSTENPTVIGRGAKIGMGAVVIQSVAEGAEVFGNPARVFAINKT
ncbi:NeuD/PglB/VioB family sugar acetyltransferase [Pseudaeromonas sharmana]|uniref:NeuD/PglB/VioB family sugar acetyltransferase n=1 Tax=Pseudaeromonas sharmana TaxID=328412 RepID=A0ABV8CJK2_9GAMM